MTCDAAEVGLAVELDPIELGVQREGHACEGDIGEACVEEVRGPLEVRVAERQVIDEARVDEIG